jgi:uncharacterized protein YjlB
MPIIIRASLASRVASGRVRFGGKKGRALILKTGDVAILPAGTAHQRLTASEDLLVVGAYPASGDCDECTSLEDRKKAIPAIPRVAWRWSASKADPQTSDQQLAL